MIKEIDASRRGFFQILGTAVTVGGLMTPAIAQESREVANKRKVKVTPPEDLMREHGVLDRLLLIYEAAMRKFAGGEDFDPDILTSSALIVRDFIENYHEKSEEEQVFPRFKKAGKMVDLVDYLLAQHSAGRIVTDTILKLAPTSRKEGEDRRQVISTMQAFITIYRPHAAWEDTDLFPKLKDVVSPHEYDAMAEDFEKKEHALFGDDGFEKTVNRVAKLEQAIGIHFTGLQGK
jgi:hemerythrin-like domain-containing protein